MADSTPLDIDKIKTLTGIESDSFEDFSEKFNKRYLTEDQIFKDEGTKSRIFGRAFGAASTGIKQLFDLQGIEITGDDLKQPIEAITKLGISKLTDKWNLEKEELQKTAGLSADEKIKEAQETINKLSAKNKDFESLLKAKATEFENLSQNQKTELKKFKLGSKTKDVTTSIQWNPDRDEYSRKGFLATMQDKYAIDLDENDEEFIVDRSTNARIKAEGSHSTFMKPAEVYQQEAIKAGLAAVNKKAGAPAPARSTETPKQVSSQSLPIAGRKQMANTRYQKED